LLKRESPYGKESKFNLLSLDSTWTEPFGRGVVRIQEVVNNIYRIKIPLPQNPLRSLNSYLIKGVGRTLIIDTGQNRDECRSAMLEAMRKLNLKLENTDFFITHQHTDHLGLLSEIVTTSSIVYMNKCEAKFIQTMEPKARLTKWSEIYRLNGFPEDEIQTVINQLSDLYRVQNYTNFKFVNGGDKIKIGNYLFTCVDTPGHSPGHMCLYEAKQQILISGDHILFDITPNIKLYPEMQNALKDYLESLDKVYPLDVKLVLPGHGKVYYDHRQRIKELREHHQNRLREVLCALDKGERTAFEIAPYVSWNMNCTSWVDFPPLQKWFAVGEIIAHLRYLEDNNQVKKRQTGYKIIYSRA